MRCVTLRALAGTFAKSGYNILIFFNTSYTVTKFCLGDKVLNGSALTSLADSATAEYELLTDFCGLAMLPEILYPQVL